MSTPNNNLYDNLSSSVSLKNTDTPTDIIVGGQVTYLENVRLSWKPSITTGGTADIYRGKHPRLGEVALKRLRSLPGSKEDDLVEGADALTYLHDKALIHGDIKGNNILVSETRHALLCDFGLSGHESDPTSGARGLAGSTRWMSPELFKGSRKSPKSDVYAFGLTICEVHEMLCTGLAQQPSRPDDPLVLQLQTTSGYEHAASPVAVVVPSWNDKGDGVDRHSSPQGFERFSRWASQFKAFAVRRWTSRASTATDLPAGPIVYSGITFDCNKPVKSGDGRPVFRGIHQAIGSVALKRLKVDNPDSCDNTPLTLEVETWKTFNHSYILSFIGAFTLDGYLYLITPWAENGTLPEYLKSNPDADRLKYILQLADALSYLHAREYIHGDIKAENVLVAYDGSSQLYGFGLSRADPKLVPSESRPMGSLVWRSPELWDSKIQTPESDVYAFGMTIYEILSGNTPFYDKKTDAALAGAVLIYDKRPPRAP
ncbi:hypothetical protein FRB99_000827, partial [Tulasnella sp. 403]